jgi:hypothetical protein
MDVADPGGNVEHLDRPLAEWSDDQLLEAYRSLSANLDEVAGQERPDKSATTEEILRRGLSLPDVPTVAKSETVAWSGEAGGEDPGSGALPRSF